MLVHVPVIVLARNHDETVFHHVHNKQGRAAAVEPDEITNTDRAFALSAAKVLAAHNDKVGY